MKRSVIIALVFVCSALVGTAQKDDVNTKKNFWPDAAQLQYAGNIGMLSAGVGYTIRRDRFRVLLVYGFVPGQFAGGNTIHLFSVKGTARLARWNINESFSIAPYAGLTGTMEPGRHSLLTLPDHFPERYYGTTSFHATLLGGTRFVIKNHDSGFPKTIEPFMELGATETLFYYKLINHEVNAARVFSTALGISFRL